MNVNLVGIFSKKRQMEIEMPVLFSIESSQKSVQIIGNRRQRMQTQSIVEHSALSSGSKNKIGSEKTVKQYSCA